MSKERLEVTTVMSRWTFRDLALGLGTWDGFKSFDAVLFGLSGLVIEWERVVGTLMRRTVTVEWACNRMGEGSWYLDEEDGDESQKKRNYYRETNMFLPPVELAAGRVLEWVGGVELG